MKYKKLRFKESGEVSYIKFIKRLSTDAAIKKRIEKAIFLIFSMMGGKLDNRDFYKILTKIISVDEYSNYQPFISSKYDYCMENFDQKKMKNSWYIKLRHFEWTTELLMDEDYVFFPDKYNPGQFVKEEEFKYLAYKLTELLVHRQGYNTIARRFFLNKNKPFHKQYNKDTGRKMTKGKLAHMNRVLSERDIIYCYKRPNKPNLYVIGKKSPYYELKDVITDNDISNIYATYNIDTTDHFGVQAYKKNLIPGKKEREFKKERLEVRRSLAREKAVKQERQKQEEERLAAFNQRRMRKDDPNEEVLTERETKLDRIIDEILDDCENSS